VKKVCDLLLPPNVTKLTHSGKARQRWGARLGTLWFKRGDLIEWRERARMVLSRKL